MATSPALRRTRFDPCVRVLHVVHRVLGALAGREIEVEVDRRVVRARQQEPARRVDADLVDQLVERHELARPLGHRRPLAAASDEVDELHDDQLERVADRRRAPRRPPSSAARSRGGRRPTRRSAAGSRARACSGGRRCRRRSRCARRSSARAPGPCPRRARTSAATAHPRWCTSVRACRAPRTRARRRRRPLPPARCAASARRTRCRTTPESAPATRGCARGSAPPRGGRVRRAPCRPRRRSRSRSSVT